jgi:AcrR family transcriptional regulator
MSGGMKSSKRMGKEMRRRQLMETALAIIRTEGVETLTLARVAERAGVSKPVAYGHFKTRAGLLIALFRDYDDRTVDAFHAALKEGGKTLRDIAGILSAAYIDSCLSMGPEIAAIFDALSVAKETQAFLREWRASIIAEFRKTFAPVVNLGERHEPVFIGILGAAESLSAAAATAQITRDDAIAALTDVVCGALADRVASP